MTRFLVPSLTEVVRANIHRAELFLISHNDPCIEIAAGEVSHIDRLIHGGFPEDLLRWQRPLCWMVAVIVCPGDDLGPLTAQVKAERLEPGRFYFYLHADADVEALEPWADARFPLDQVRSLAKDGQPIDSWAKLHSVLGYDFNGRVALDFGPAF